ncbi:thermonuclease family protein [Roseivirga sp. BDSF3-8]|uniref:thermonuclease family protein n=1 Tax=Roseivirga sp. BDSF3-8 TaxID=3241598 RepID=UPI0035322CED
MKILLSLLLSVTLVAGAFAKETVNGKVMEVREGDHLVISVGDGVMVNVRLDEIDCPEQGQPFFDDAKRFTEKLTLGKDVSVEVSEKKANGTLIGIVSLVKKEQVLNYELVEAGYAWHMQQGLTYTEHTDSLLDLMDKAQEKGKGLWKEGNPVAPWAYRQRQNMYEAKSSMD